MISEVCAQCLNFLFLAQKQNVRTMKSTVKASTRTCALCIGYIAGKVAEDAMVGLKFLSNRRLKV